MVHYHFNEQNKLIKLKLTKNTCIFFYFIVNTFVFNFIYTILYWKNVLATSATSTKRILYTGQTTQYGYCNTDLLFLLFNKKKYLETIIQLAPFHNMHAAYHRSKGSQKFLNLSLSCWPRCTGSWGILARGEGQLGDVPVEGGSSWGKWHLRGVPVGEF